VNRKLWRFHACPEPCGGDGNWDADLSAYICMLCGRTVATDEPTERVVRYEGWAEPNSKTGLDLSKNTSKG